MPLPETSVRTTSRVRPPLVRAATTKSPEKDWPPAGRSAISRCQPCGRRGQLALHPDAFAQVEEHGAAAPPGHADPAAELGDEQAEEAAGGDDQDGARGDSGRALRCTGRARADSTIRAVAAAAYRPSRLAGRSSRPPATIGRTSAAGETPDRASRCVPQAIGGNGQQQHRPARASRSRRRGSSRRRLCAAPMRARCTALRNRAVNESAAARAAGHCSGPYPPARPSPSQGGPTVTNGRPVDSREIRSRCRASPARHGHMTTRACGCCGRPNGTTGTGSWMLAFGGVAGAPGGARTVRTLTEPERSIGAWDGDECVGTAGAFTLPADGAGRRLGAGRGRHDGRAWRRRTGGAGCSPR